MPKFIKGSQEARDYMASIRQKRNIDPEKAKQNKEIRLKRKENRDYLTKQVDIPIFGNDTLIIPEYMAIKTKRGYKIVNPLTQERHLSSRDQTPSIKILRKPVNDMVLLEGFDAPIPMSLFSKKDRLLIDKSFENVDLYKNSELDAIDLPTIKLKNVKSRGRPEVLHKNIEYNRLHKKELKNDGEPEEEISKKKRSKYLTDDERYKAKLNSNKLKRQEKRKLNKQLKEPQIEEPQIEEPQIEESQIPEPKIEEPKIEEPQIPEFKNQTDRKNYFMSTSMRPTQTHLPLSTAKLGTDLVLGIEKNNVVSNIKCKLDQISVFKHPGGQKTMKVIILEKDGEKVEPYNSRITINDIKTVGMFYKVNPYYPDKEQQGRGIMNKFKYIKTVINGRNDYPPKVRGIIQKYGNQEIKSIVIRRNPLQSIMNFALNAVSLGGWNKNMEDKPYDTLFHLSIVLMLNNNVRVVLEKNEVINMDTVIRVAPKTEIEDIPDIQSGLTLNTLLNNAKDRMGSKYFTYSAKDNNCQDFILAVLQANNIGNQEDYSFIKQDTKSLFEGLSTLRKVSNSITDLGAKVNEITQGTGLFGKIDKALNPRKNGVSKFVNRNSRKIGSVAVHTVLPMAIAEGTSGLVTGLSGNPVLGMVVGNTLGQYAGQKAGDALGKRTGLGLLKKSRFIKGSQEAKDFMERLREKRKK